MSVFLQGTERLPQVICRFPGGFLGVRADNSYLPCRLPSPLFRVCERSSTLKSLLGALVTGGLHVQRIQRLAAGHKQAVLFDAAEAQVRAGFRKANPSNQFTAGREAMHAVRPWPGPAHTGPQVAVAISSHAIGESGRHIGENLASTQFPAVHYFENSDVPRCIGIVRDTTVGNVEQRLVGGKHNPLGMTRSSATTVAAPVTVSSR